LTDDSELRAVGDRIAGLLDGLQASADEAVMYDVEELVKLVTDLYGGALARVMALADPGLAAALAEDELVGSLLLVHDLHPDSFEVRASRAVEAVAAPGGEVDAEIVGREVRLVVTGGGAELAERVRKSVADAVPDGTVSVESRAAPVPVRIGKRHG
jgi:hypothetical protein